jgi:hypothetical protein
VNAGDRDAEIADFLVYRPKARVRRWSLMRTEDGFRVVGPPPERSELDRALREAGARRGMTVEVGPESYEFFP